MHRGRSAVTPPAVIVAVGVLLLGAAIGHHTTEVFELTGRLGPLAGFLLDGMLPVGLVGGGYWLSRTDLDPVAQWTVCRWSLAGVFLFPLLFAATMATPGHEPGDWNE